MQWVNKVLLEMWPFYDYAVCEMLKVRDIILAVHVFGYPPHCGCQSKSMHFR